MNLYKNIRSAIIALGICSLIAIAFGLMSYLTDDPLKLKYAWYGAIGIIASLGFYIQIVQAEDIHCIRKHLDDYNISVEDADE